MRTRTPSIVHDNRQVLISPSTRRYEGWCDSHSALAGCRVGARLARARAQGVRLGGPPRRIDPERLAAVAGLPEREAARRLGIPRSMLQKFRTQRNDGPLA